MEVNSFHSLKAFQLEPGRNFNLIQLPGKDDAKLVQLYYDYVSNEIWSGSH